MTYEEMMAMIGGGQESGNLEDQIKMQLEQAASLRKGNTPQMRQAGNVMVAPHPLELLGGLAKEFAGQNLQNQAQASQKSVRGIQQKQFADYLRALAGGQAPQEPAGNGFQMPKAPTGLQMPAGYGN